MSATDDRTTPDFQALFEQAPSPLLVLRANAPQYTIVAVNEEYLRSTMTRREDILGRDLFEVFPDDPAEPEASGVANLRASLDRVVAKRVSDAMRVQRYPVRQPQSEGGAYVERYWTPVNAPVFGRGGELLWIIHRVEDVTEFVLSQRQGARWREQVAELWQRVKTAESELSRRARELESANSELEAFTYSVSHDLRAPLRGLSGFSQALLRHYSERLDDRGRDYLSRINNAALRMGRLIDELLQLSRLSRVALARRRVDLGAIVERRLQELRSAEPHRRVELDLQRPLAAWGDPILLEAVVVNLLDNAWKFTARHPTAHIHIGSWRQPNRDRVFFVRDDGAGFDMRFASNLFGAFQRLHSQSEFPGTGVGLAAVRRILRRHGGEICAEAEPERGAAFYFTLGPQPDTASELEDDSAHTPAG